MCMLVHGAGAGGGRGRDGATAALPLGTVGALTLALLRSPNPGPDLDPGLCPRPGCDYGSSCDPCLDLDQALACTEKKCRSAAGGAWRAPWGHRAAPFTQRQSSPSYYPPCVVRGSPASS